MSQLSVRWIERQRYEALKTVRLVLLLAQFHEMDEGVNHRQHLPGYS